MDAHQLLPGDRSARSAWTESRYCGRVSSQQEADRTDAGPRL